MFTRNYRSSRVLGVYMLRVDSKSIIEFCIKVPLTIAHHVRLKSTSGAIFCKKFAQEYEN